MTTLPLATVDALRRTRTAQLVLLCAVLAFALASAAGLTQRLLFDSPSPLKYAVTVAFSIYLLIVVSASKPLLVMTVTTAFVAPFAAGATFGGLVITLGLLALSIGVVSLLVSRSSDDHDGGTRRSFLAVAGPIAVAGLAAPLMHSRHFVKVIVVVLAITCVAWLVARVARQDGNRRWVIGGLCAGATLQAGFGCYEFFTGRPLNLYGGSAGYGTSYFFIYASGQSSLVFRPSAGLPDPISLGNLLAVALPLLVALAFSTTARWQRFAVSAAAVVTLAGLAVTLSRMSWFGAAGGLIVAIALLPPRKLVLAVAVLVMAAVPVVFLTESGLAGDAVTDRVSSAFDPTGTSTATREEDLTRVEIWHAAVDVAVNNPLAGVGLDNLPPYLVAAVPLASEATHAHSTYLNVLAEAGAIGIIGLLYLVFSAVRDAIRGLRLDRCLFAGIVGALVTMLIVWTTDYTVRTPAMAIVFGLIIGLAATGSRPVIRP
ncbi:O-antigen ligase family protein [Dactylosporangium vinaceum]|uniref:O-antigen ligase family protein n=1 Tax=Dactylosporangium vinaceum TaxID=53362 RepID=A0ABV5MJ83_9ACTN|nr:O-antigen ligase family protein [Dactylosporangium vinaceum]UAB97603.1 O-antigen ligase family protein [Dactylosporangium vinaceum]